MSSLASTSTRPADLHFHPGRTAWAFMQDRSPVSGIMGPVGSGKSVASVMRALLHMTASPKSRGCIIRNTYRELKDTTLATWLEWLGPYGEMNLTDMVWTSLIPGHECQVLFRALDKPSDVGKLLSLELTWAWINEAREVPRSIVDMVQTRLGRYPRWIEGPAPWYGLFMDTNPPDDLSWWYRLFEEQRPQGWNLYRQPGALEPDAENLNHLPPDYYQRLTQGKDAAWIDVYVHGRYGYVQDGKPVYPEFHDRLHVGESAQVKDQPVVVGLDFGLTPAATFMQLGVNGQYRVLHEIVTEDCGAEQFAPLVKRLLAAEYPGSPVRIWGDPSGDERSKLDGRTTPYDILRAAGVEALPADCHGNDPVLRRAAVSRNLTRLTMTGEPGLLIHPRCKYLRRGMAGGFKYRLINASGDERFHLEPDKNLYSHVCEALEYALLGAGEGRAVMGQNEKLPPLRINYAGTI
jgi:hypothetical protein